MSEDFKTLNAWIAEHVMDLKYDPTSENWYDPLHPKLNPKAFDCPSYTTDPAAAMEVLKKCGEIYFPSIYKSRADGESWCVEDSNKRQILFTKGSTLELAICLFAKQLFERSGK